ncbi:MAG TPA: hypothetical protein VJ903_02925, partial [Clostridia bacterium]|nr:hypothetical protein [Clostridia bacterium]
DSTHKTAFAYGEDFSSANLAITATFSDQSTARITTGFDVDSTAYNKEHGLESEQTYDILLSYMDYTTSYKVTVARAMVVGVYIVDNKVDFKYGEEFSLGNAKFYAMYENSAYTEELTVSEELGSGKCMIHSESYDREHEKVDTQRYSILVEYSENVSESYEVTVAPIPYWVEYRVGAESTHQTEFGKSETFTYEGLIVESVYGSEENGDLYVRTCAEYEYTIFSDAFDGTTPDTYGTTPDTYGCYEVLVRIGEGITQTLYHIYVTDEYENITGIYAFLVNEQYYQYAELDLTDIIFQVYLSDSDGYTVFLPNDLVEVTGFDSSSVGDKELIFTYKEQEYIASYSVIEDEIDYIDVVVDDTFRYQYYLNEELSYQGITVYQVYKSGRKEVKVDYTKETDYDSSTAGDYSLTIEEEWTYDIYVYDYSPATAPQDIDLYGENDTFYAEEVANGRWQVEVGGAGEYELTAYLGSDFMSYCDVMLGEYTEGVFFALLSEDFDRYIINYDGTGDLTVTIRITNPNGNVSYTYLTISSEDVYFSEITINGEEIQLSVYNEYRYYINDVANSYVFDWNIDSKYTVTGVVKGSTVTLDSYDYSKHLAIFVQEGNDIVATYEVIMLPYLLVSSISIGEMDATKEKMYSQTKFVADITNIYGASSYAVDIIVQDGFTTKLRYGGVEIESIDAEILFAGRNYFNVEVYDNDGECVAKYDLDIIIYEPSFMPKYALMKIEDAVVANLHYNPGGNFSKTYYVFDDALETEQNYSLTFYWDGEMPIGTVVTLADNELWENGGDITLNPGRNEFVVKVSDGTNTYYQAFIILYADYNLPSYEPWAHVDLYVAGVQAENNIGILPLSYDVFFITIPNGYDFYTDITNIVEIVTDEGNDISMYEFAYEVNEQHDKITVSVLEDSVLVGYLYVNIIYEGETNADTTLIVYDMTLVEAMREEPLNEVEFAPNTEHDSRMEATISSVNGNFIVFVYPDFASCTVETSVPDAISFIDKHVSMITYEGTGSFEIYFHVTSSDGQEDVNYCLIVNIEEAEDVLTLSFGGEDLLELDYTLIDMYMAFENEGSIYIDIPTLQIDPNGFDTINNTVTFVLTSEYLCVEEDTITEISNGIAHTFNMYPNNEEFTTCYMVEFYLCLEDSYSNNGIVHITLYFHLPIMKMTFSDGTSLAQYAEIGDFVWEEDDNLYYEMTMEKFEAKLDVDDKFVVDLTFYMPDFVCYYADETGTYLPQVNNLEIEFIKNTDVLEGTVTFCQRGEADAEDTFTDIVIIVAN